MFSPGRIHQLVDINGVFFGNKYLKKYLNWQRVSISYLVFSLERPQVLTLKSTHGFDCCATSKSKTSFPAFLSKVSS